jgi:hypothetical protein
MVWKGQNFLYLADSLRQIKNPSLRPPRLVYCCQVFFNCLAAESHLIQYGTLPNPGN